MGLDICLWTPNQEDFGIETEEEYRHHQLSRTFCNLMCRPGVVDEEPELDQIERLTGVSVAPIYDMEKYYVAEELEEELEFSDSEEEKQKLRDKAANANAKLEGNIESVLSTVTQLLTQLAPINDLPARLLPTKHDTLNRETYFADFNRDTGDGYIRNNFGQDLRNFKSFLEYAESKGSRTVFFRYG
jgi:hypothetical protein